MSFFGKIGLVAGLAVLLATANGCLPSDSSSMDEEKEPHYVLGKSRVNAQDYPGAIEAFQEALEANPRSAAAHFQLACIYDSRQSDPAAAIYHFQEYLRLNPQAGNIDVIRQRIYTCKQLLAADTMPLPSSPAAQKQLDGLMQQKVQLQQEVDRLTDQIRQWNAYYAAQQAAAARAQAAVPAGPAGSTGLPVAGGQPPEVSNDGPAAANRRPAPPVAPVHTYKVLPGETYAKIARKFGCSQASLEASNPGVNPRRLRAGQVLNLPPQ